MPRVAAQQREKKLLHAALRKTKASKPKTKFTDDAAKISAYWQGDALNAGDKVRAVWIAEAVGEHPEAVITEASVIAYRFDEEGVFSLAQPQGGWPTGNYRVEIYVGDRLAETLKFMIEAGPVIQLH